MSSAILSTFKNKFVKPKQNMEFINKIYISDKIQNPETEKNFEI